ncbi:acyl-CoA dehydrogenase family protein [Glutamicibacter sp. MNS18]|uniref:acyl-CoA dehydrogenase family protein n=1 Tax=Glutamicibacter sp. MNS18 TaxID=2989817 RepID=UPI002235C3B5|nr:acyl-CoA dehydrogenase family protein [Glutamicibacter sp. MNS18]MCW4467216.1 acyl-CoA dehydrogenase family protein [Glutamicibacter sp. MNS18]
MSIESPHHLGNVPRTSITEVIERIHEIGPLLRSNAIAADRDRRVPDESMDALEAAGAFSLLIPERFGGLGAGAADLVDVARLIGRFDPAASWVTVISNGSAMLALRFPQTSIDRIFGSGRPVRMSSIIVSQGGHAVREADGYRISGKWPFASNSLHAQWAVVVVPIQQTPDGEAVPGYALVREDQWEVLDTWQTIGMRGTGSNTLAVSEGWIPEDQIVTADQLLGPAAETLPDALDIQRLAPVSTMSTAIAAPSLGAADALLELVAEQAHQRGITYSNYRPQTTSEAFVRGLGEVRAKIDGAGLLLERSAKSVDAASREPNPLSPADRARCRNDVAHAAHSLTDAANDLAWLYGTALFADTNPVGRLWRDINTGTRHALVASPLGYEIGGAGYLGLEPPAPIV